MYYLWHWCQWGREWHEKNSIGKEVEHDEDVYLVFLELRCFWSMFPSMPKWEIVSMNVDAIGEHYRTLFWCIYNYVCHWWKHSNNFVKIDRAADCDFCIKDNISLIYLCVVSSAYDSMSLLQG